MSIDASMEGRKELQPQQMIVGNRDGNGISSLTASGLSLKPNMDHHPNSYDDLQLEFSPLLFSALERYLPCSVLSMSRNAKVQFMKEILNRYLPESERIRIRGLKGYRQKIISNYKSMHKELYTMNAESFFVPSFLRAINENTEESFRCIMAEPTPGIFTFEMLQPEFCRLLLSEVENFERWVHEVNYGIMRPNTMNEYGIVLDDFGFETMLGQLRDDYIKPISKVFFPEVGGSTLDCHHGFIVEYGTDRDVELGFHVDDSEVTLNVCLGRQFSGGELFFRGVRCDRHVNAETKPEEVLDHSHVPGCAVLHRGRHRHGARATTFGHRVNLILWCRSSIFRELKRYQRDCSSWCGECQDEKRERQRLSIAATKQELLSRERRSAP